MKVQFKTSVKVYADEPMALFSIEYTDGLANASIPETEDQTLSSFPSFLVEETNIKRASLTWSGSSKSKIITAPINHTLINNILLLHARNLRHAEQGISYREVIIKPKLQILYTDLNIPQFK